MNETDLISWTSPAIPVGSRFGRLVVLETFKRPGPHWSKANYFARCACDCGSPHRLLKVNNLRSGNTLSCGCVMRDGRQRSRLTRTAIGRVWRNMMNRCYRPATAFYENYGGRGIGVCDRWHDLRLFAEDMLPTYQPHLTIERIDSDSDYCPENCRWANRQEQSRNRRSNIRVEIDGVTKCLTEWAEDFGIRPKTVQRRVREMGWSPMKALTTPVR